MHNKNNTGHPMLKHLAALPAATAVLLMGLASHAIAASNACVQPALPERPELEHYHDYSAFIADIMTFKRLEAELHNSPARCPLPDASTPIHYNEDLGEAVASARQQPRFDYRRNTTWYDRSTSQSFVLQRLNGRELADERLHAGPLTEQRLLPRAALVRLPSDWRSARHADEQELYRDIEARQLDAGSQNAGLSLVQRTRNLVLFFDQDGALARTQGNVYVSAGRCVANCRAYD